MARAHHGIHLGVAVGRAKDPREQLESEKRGVGGGPAVERVGERGFSEELETVARTLPRQPKMTCVFWLLCMYHPQLKVNVVCFVHVFGVRIFVIESYRYVSPTIGS